MKLGVAERPRAHGHPSLAEEGRGGAGLSTRWDSAKIRPRIANWHPDRHGCAQAKPNRVGAAVD